MGLMSREVAEFYKCLYTSFLESCHGLSYREEDEGFVEFLARRRRRAKERKRIKGF